MEKADGVPKRLQIKGKQEVINFHGAIGTVGAIGGSGHTINLSSTARVERQTENNPGVSICYNLKHSTLIIHL